MQKLKTQTASNKLYSTSPWYRAKIGRREWKIMENLVIHALQSASHEYWGSLYLKHFVSPTPAGYFDTQFSLPDFLSRN